MKRRIGVLAGVVVLLAAAVLGTLTLTKVWDPFGTDVVDRSQPAVLKSLRDLSQFHAAAGDYQVVLDIEQDVRFVPDALAGQRTLFVAAGTVNAFVDFSTMDERAMTVSQENKTVEIDLPSPQLDKPNLQQDKCYVFAQERGLFDRLASLVQAQDQQAFYVAAEQKLAEAAQTSELRKRAVDSTKKMLTGMLGALGYQVSFRGSDD